jgi:transposase-like protein
LEGSVNLSVNPIAKGVLSLFVMYIKRNKTHLKYIGCVLYLYFLGLSYRNTSKALARFVKRSHVAFWKWIQRYEPKKIARKRKRISEFMIDQTLAKIGLAYMWIWVVAIELKSREILALF